MTRHVLSISDLDRGELAEVLDLAGDTAPPPLFAGLGVALVFEHPSARTRNAAELAVAKLAGHPVAIRGEEIGIDRRETAEDVARTLASYHAIIAARVERHSTLERMASALDAAHVAVPVVNLLSDHEHPTQAIADLLTLRQHLGSLDGATIAYVGDANNVCRSLVGAASLSGVTVHVSSPEGYRLSPSDLEWAEQLGGSVRCFDVPADAVAGAQAIYTDVWISMGQEGERDARLAAFGGYAVDEALLSAAADDVLVLHCLPAHRGEEVSAGVIDGPNSVVWEQAANRMNALLGLFRFLREAVLETRRPGQELLG